MINSTAALIPQPQFSISVPEEPLELRPGDSKTADLRISSTIPIGSNISFSNSVVNGSEVEFLPRSQNLPPNGPAIEQIRFHVLQNATNNNGTQARYTIPVKIQPIIYFPKIKIILPYADQTSISYATNRTLTPNFFYMTLSILPPPTIPEQLNNFVRDWISSISGLWSFLAGIAVIVGPFAIRRYSKKYNKKISDWFKGT